MTVWSWPTHWADAYAESCQLREDCPDPEPEPQPSRWSFTAGCPRCAEPLEHVASGCPGVETRAIARCNACGKEWGFVVQMRDVTREIAGRRDYEALKDQEQARRRRRRRAEGRVA